VAVSVTATDPSGITKVELYIDNVLINTDTASPYVFTANTTGLADGSHSLTAKAYDAAGFNAISGPVSITVTSAPGATTQCGAMSGTPPWTYCITRTNGSTSSDVLYFLHGLGGDQTSWNSLYQNIRDAWSSTGVQAPIVVNATFGSNEWLVDPNGSPNSGMLGVYVNTVMPAMESLIGFNPAISKRKLFGESMGGFNGSQVLLKYGNLFSRVALADPALMSIPPYPTQTQLNNYVSSTGATASSVNYILSNMQVFFPDNSSWPNTDPIARSLQLLSASSPPLYVSGDSTDEFGFQVGDQQFANNATSKGEPTMWELVTGNHFTKDAPALANFLAQP
jgi:pimeloyl-ACP methyl ester carboxylesterase